MVAVIERGELKIEIQRIDTVIAGSCFGDQFFPDLPFALGRGDDCAFDGRLALGLECVHQRQSDQVVFAGDTEQFQPRTIDLGHDTFLHVGDRAGRPFHVVV